MQCRLATRAPCRPPASVTFQAISSCRLDGFCSPVTTKMLDDNRLDGFMLKALPGAGALDLKTKGGAAMALAAVISAAASTNDYRASVMSGMALSESSTNPTLDDMGVPSTMVSNCFQPGFKLLSILLGDERGDSEKCMQEWSDAAAKSK